MVRHGKELRTVLRGLLKPIAVLVLFAILLLAEPDFGATVIMMGTAFGMLFMGARAWFTCLVWYSQRLAVLLG